MHEKIEVPQQACANCSHPKHMTARKDVDGSWLPGCNLRIKTPIGYVFCNCQHYIKPQRRRRVHRVSQTS